MSLRVQGEHRGHAEAGLLLGERDERAERSPADCRDGLGVVRAGRPDVLISPVAQVA